MTDPLIRVLGWHAMFIQGDPMVYDRLRWLSRHLRSGKLRTLDAGCGNGAFTLFAARIGNDAVGISFDAANNRKATARAVLLGITGARFVQGDLRHLDTMCAELGSFDQVICLETIEHIMDDHKLARDLSAMLKPGGRLFLSAPNSQCPPMRGDKISAVENGDHVRWGYTHEEMRAMLAEAGLETVSEEYCSGLVSQRIGNLERSIGQFTPMLGWAATFPLRALQVADRVATDSFGALYFSIAVVAEKAKQ